ncbi:biliverdin-producing heme oxygenase [Xanthobacter sp. KR7-225]|uniref:biliverdin-producing heme oxygenase n=1 Tax=Xanthobacter sp. KR7-225 TaxID=3156613 RepID=UPI0032B5692C
MSVQLHTFPPVPTDGERRRSRLRAATRSAHAQVDRTILSLVGRGRAGYADYLAASLAARQRLEAPAFAAGSPVARFLAAVRQDLVADLAACAAASGAAPRALAPAEALEPTDHAALWGIGYVLAGSCLGAAHLMRHAAPLGVSADFGARHLARQAAAARLWPAFLEALAAAPFTPRDEARCIEAALAAFSVYDRALAAGRSD